MNDLAYGIFGLPLLASALAATGCDGASGNPREPVTPAAATAAAASSGAASAAGGDTQASGTPAGVWPFVTLSPEDKSAQLARLQKDAEPLKSNWVPPGKRERYGHAEGVINASAETVRAKLTDYAHYKDLAGPKFKSVRVVDKEGDHTDVYFQLPIMKGLITIWYVTRFGPMRAASGGDVVEGSYVKGNIKGMHIAFNVRPGADETTSVLVCDLVLVPTVPAPESALDEELRDACGDAVHSLRRTLSAR